jgi:hypothetical protein
MRRYSRLNCEGPKAKLTEFFAASLGAANLAEPAVAQRSGAGQLASRAPAWSATGRSKASIPVGASGER